MCWYVCVEREYGEVRVWGRGRERAGGRERKEEGKKQEQEERGGSNFLCCHIYLLSVCVGCMCRLMLGMGDHSVTFTLFSQLGSLNQTQSLQFIQCG